MQSKFLKLSVLFSAVLYCLTVSAQPKPSDNLQFDSLATRWDEGMPLGNGWLGEMIWKKDNKLRISLDRVDLWDDRPMPKIGQLKFKWVIAQLNKGQYDTVHKIGDEPYDKSPAPTKIPGAALEFNYMSFGKVVSNNLNIKTALSTIKFQNGVVLYNYVHAKDEIGYFEFENLPTLPTASNENPCIPQLMVPNYNSTNKNRNDDSHSGEGLQTLDYKKGTVTKTANSIRYHQPTWNGNYYEVLVQWKRISPTEIIGSWTISNNKKAFLPELKKVKNKLPGWQSHNTWWNHFWNQSSVSVPDSILERQYYLELYKMGCVARTNTPPISLQAVWTEDNGNLPPWKGDIHNDLNTELSYWPFYTGNHLEEAKSFTNWLWKNKGQNEKWTKNYFDITGLNVPGVTTISGKAMGGWIQYSMSPTTAAWLSQYFYWQWKYSMDKTFLLERCKPYFDEVHEYFKKILSIDPATKKYKLPLDSSPEIFDNSTKAWFHQWTNYDLSLVKSFYDDYEEVLQAATGKVPADIEREKSLLPGLNTNETGLTIAPGLNLFESHRHMSPYMAIYPLDLLDIENKNDSVIIKNSLHQIEKKGTREWCGYSFSWMACLYAKAKEEDSAAKMLRIFATNFCSINSFHLNGDQKGGEYSDFTYRPFTLEGNFAFAKGIQEMLLQSHKSYIEIFPAIPSSWKDVSFTNLRTQGAFLVSAKKENGITSEVKILSQKGGLFRLKIPFKTFYITDASKKYSFNKLESILEIKMKAGEEITLKNSHE
ncbi:MAG TPA: glycoside hydrolase N-terminal domain-containing protein [Hanamia sp.]|nr:glycoside hydrolase N-terminal domain-containing protein [Hanamia sp.]